MTRTAHRLDGIPPTIFTTMSALAMRTGAVNLGQGFPDADGPPSVLAAADEAMRAGANQYAPGPGVPALRQAIARHQQRHYGIELDPDREVVVTTGCTEGVAAALLGLVDPGDEVVVLEPYYDSYVAMIQLAGAVRRPVTLRAPDFRLDADALRAAVGPRTRFVLLNSPHNPTGTVLTRAELQAVADVAIEHDLVVITDEVYEHLTFRRRHEHVPIATLPGMWERTLTLSSAGKSLQRHRLEGRLGHRSAPSSSRRSALGQAVADLHLGRPAPAGDRGGARRGARLATGAGARPAGTPRPALRRARLARARRTPSRGHLLRAQRHLVAGLEGRHGVLPRPPRAGRRRRDPDAAVPRHRRGRPAGAVGVLQGGERHRGGSLRLAGADLSA